MLDPEKSERQLKISSKLTQGHSTQHPVHFLLGEPLSITLNPRILMIEISSSHLFLVAGQNIGLYLSVEVTGYVTGCATCKERG